MHVNHQWDLEYQDLEEKYRKYRIDSERKQAESQSMVIRFQNEKEKISERMKVQEIDYMHCQRDRSDMRLRIISMEKQLNSRFAGSNVGGAMVSSKRVRELEEECQLLAQQVRHETIYYVLPTTIITHHHYCPPPLLPTTIIAHHHYCPPPLLPTTIIAHHHYCPPPLLPTTIIAHHLLFCRLQWNVELVVGSNIWNCI